MDKLGLKNNDLISILSEVTDAFVGQLDMQVLLDKIINTTMDILDAEVCSIFLKKDNDPDVIKCVAGSGFAKQIVNIAEYRSGEGFTGTVFETGEIINIKNSKNLEEITKKGRWIGKYDTIQWESYGGVSQYRNGIIMPLKIRGEILGVIKAENKKTEKFFFDCDQKTFEAIASIISLVIENSKLHQRIENQLKTIAAKAAHRINNHIFNFDSLELDLKYEISSGSVKLERLSDFSEDLKNTTDNLKRMVNEFREYGKPISLKKLPTDINDLINHEIRFANQKDKIKIEFIAAPNIPKISIDGPRLAESIKELIKNSKTAISEISTSGTIIISTELSKNRTKKKDSKIIKIVIKDDGPGIPENFPLFSPFNTTNPKGTGLGLATVKEIVNAHDGQIEYIQQIKGACFLISLPVEG